MTISDFVADVRASTPSNAAEIAVPDQMGLLRWLRGAEDRIAQAEETKLQSCRRRLQTLAEKRVMKDQLAFVQDRRMLLTHLHQRLGDLSSRGVGEKRREFSALAASLDAMGFTYLGPIDGHDLSRLCNVLQWAKELRCPVVVHVHTLKGKGYAPAERDPGKFHGRGAGGQDLPGPDPHRQQEGGGQRGVFRRDGRFARSCGERHGTG